MIKLNRDLWKNVGIGEISEVQYGSSHKSTDSLKGYKTFRMNEIINGIAIDNNSMKTTPLNKIEFEKYKLFQGDILFNRTNSFEHVGRTGIFLLEGEYMFASYLLRLKINKERVNQFYLNTIMNSNWFQTNIKRFATKAVGQANINAKSLSNFTVPLPPLEEQKQIATLFQSVEKAIEMVEIQWKHLKFLQTNLTNGLLVKEPLFGNLLKSSSCTQTTFDEIAECDKTYPEHEKEVNRFVGLEFLEADNFQLQGWGEIADGTTFSKRFVKGDVLFGKRRAYLKKVAVADFDGVCSGDILVIRAKKDKMLQELLPFYISADIFIQHAVTTSAGSLSPRTKWKDLATMAVSIPDLQSQQKILDVFQNLGNAVNHLNQQKMNLKNVKQKLLNEILS